MQKLGIFGGTFNPIHCGHLRIAETALKQVQLDRVIWVPAHFPPHKPQADLAAFQHRLAMVKQAIACNPAFVCSEIEQRRTSASYAIDTFLDLQAQYSDCRWFWVLGIDAFQSLPRWRGRQKLADCCQWLVAPRSSGDGSASAPGKRVVEQMQAEDIAVDWQLLQMQPLMVSSSLVRQHYRDRRPISGLVPDVVQTYIATHQLYSNNA
jgi:nicotinate-nucleotide adenylyltransferase